MKCRDCANLCWSTGLHINMCYAKFIPIGDYYDMPRECDMFEQGKWKGIYQFDPPHIKDEVKE